jgi:hypothetical protein
MDGMGSPKDQYMLTRLADKIDQVVNGISGSEPEPRRWFKVVRLNACHQQETVDIAKPSG